MQSDAAPRPGIGAQFGYVRHFELKRTVEKSRRVSRHRTKTWSTYDMKSVTNKVDALFKEWDKPHSPGCAIGIIKNGQFVYKRGYGMANLEYTIPISSTTVFRIGSTSKQFTATCVALLANQGKLSLDHSIRRYLPEMPGYSSSITIRHLLHHTSGAF